MLNLQTHADGVILLIRAHPGAKRSEIRGVHEGALKVFVTAAPEKGKANKAIIAILAQRFSIAKSRVELLTGETNSRKRFLLHGMSEADARKALPDIESDDH